jgi:hypothetical protein
MSMSSPQVSPRKAAAVRRCASYCEAERSAKGRWRSDTRENPAKTPALVSVGGNGPDLLLICRNCRLRCRALPSSPRNGFAFIARGARPLKAGLEGSAKARGSSFETTNMTAKPKFDPERHEENPEWTARDFAKARPASEVFPAEVIAQFRNKRVEPEPDHP